MLSIANIVSKTNGVTVVIFRLLKSRIFIANNKLICLIKKWLLNPESWLNNDFLQHSKHDFICVIMLCYK